MCGPHERGLELFEIFQGLVNFKSFYRYIRLAPNVLISTKNIGNILHLVRAFVLERHSITFAPPFIDPMEGSTIFIEKYTEPRKAHKCSIEFEEPTEDLKLFIQSLLLHHLL